MSDLIDRQVAINAIERNAYRHTYIDQIVDIINDLPSVQPRKGKWIKAYGYHEAFGERPLYYCCSECNKLTSFSYDFCPNCGADMREGDAE